MCAKPTSTTSLWKLYIESFATAQDNVPLLWFEDLPPEIVCTVVTIGRGQRIDSSIKGGQRARELMHGAGALYFDPQAIDVLYVRTTGFRSLGAREANLDEGLLALPSRPAITEHNYYWNQNFRAGDVKNFIESNLHVINPQQWFMEVFRVMVCSESTGSYTQRLTLNNRVFRLAKNPCGVTPSTIVSKGLRAPLYQAFSSFRKFGSQKLNFQADDSQANCYLTKQLFENGSMYSKFVCNFIYIMTLLALRNRHKKHGLTIPRLFRIRLENNFSKEKILLFLIVVDKLLKNTFWKKQAGRQRKIRFCSRLCI